jgi:inorganic triphosphatase YgiF
VSAREPQRYSKEVELKFEFDPADAARVASHPVLRESLAPPEERDLISVYFDTSDFALREAGVYLRVRDTGARYMQTIKSMRSEAEPMERLEWEREIPSTRPELDNAEGTALAPLLTPEVRASLRPLFETLVKRKTFLVASGDSEIEVAIDEGEIASGRRRRPILELELELKRGETRELFRLARTLAETLPLRLAVKTKAERGYELLEGGTHDVEKAAELDVKPNMTSGEAFRTIARSCLRQIIVNEPAMCRGHAEALHQMRIGLRRLRAAISIFDDVVADQEQEKIKAELKWITQELGPARDLDVFAADVLKPLQAAHPDDEKVAATQRDFDQRRAAAYARAAGSVRSDRFRNAVLDLVEWVEVGSWSVDDEEECRERRTRPVADLARKKLARLRKRVKKGADLRHQNVRQRHKLRIRAKRLRYATEFFASTFEGEASAKRRGEALSALKDLQDALGGLNDIATRHTLIVHDADGAPQPAPHPGLPASSNQAEALLHKAEDAFARFVQAKAFWKA